MAYPPAPWTLRGYVLQTLHLVDTERVHSLIPPEFHLVPILPGKSLCTLSLVSYEQGSVLQYHELIAAFLIRYRYTVRFWVSHIYVDSEESKAGGREIWGLPKEIAHFTWQLEKRHIAVERNGNTVCQINFDSPRWLFTLPAFAPAISLPGPDVLAFTARVRASVGLARGHLDIPAESPLAGFALKQAVQTYHSRDTHFVIPPARVIGQSSND